MSERPIRPQRIMLLGAQGQVGVALAHTLPAFGAVEACDRARVDLASAAAIRSAVRELEPDIIVNAAAYTAVDRAESEAELAMAINGAAPGILAEEARNAVRKLAFDLPLGATDGPGNATIALVSFSKIRATSR